MLQKPKKFKQSKKKIDKVKKRANANPAGFSKQIGRIMAVSPSSFPSNPRSGRPPLPPNLKKLEQRDLLLQTKYNQTSPKENPFLHKIDNRSVQHCKKTGCSTTLSRDYNSPCVMAFMIWPDLKFRVVSKLKRHRKHEHTPRQTTTITTITHQSSSSSRTSGDDVVVVGNNSSWSSLSSSLLSPPQETSRHSVGRDDGESRSPHDQQS
jgi:hypothetical protein